MPRVARREYAGVVYHAIARFVDHRFELDEPLRLDAKRILGRVFSGATDWKLLAYAFMSSHWHIVAIAGELPSVSWTRRVNTALAKRIQSVRRERGERALGPVFAGRPDFVGVPKERVSQVLAYVHLNPVRANVVSGPGDSSWTSHREFLGLAPAPSWLQVNEGLRLSGYGNDSEGRRMFGQFVELHTDGGRDLLDWNPEILASAMRAVRRVVGTTASLAGPNLEVPKGVSVEVGVRKAGPVTHPHEPRRLIEAVAMTAGISVSDLVSQRRDPALVECRRRAIRYWALQGGRIEDIASALGMHKSTAYAHLLQDSA